MSYFLKKDGDLRLLDVIAEYPQKSLVELVDNPAEAEIPVKMKPVFA